jgi:hypothetical protein
MEALLAVADVSDDALARVSALQLTAKDELAEVIGSLSPEQRSIYRLVATYLSPAGMAGFRDAPELYDELYSLLLRLHHRQEQGPRQAAQDGEQQAQREG